MSLIEEVSGQFPPPSGLTVTEEWHPLLIGGESNPAMTFSSFHEGTANTWLMEVIRNVCENRRKASTSLIFIHGSPGLGKTHLLSAAAAAAKGRAHMIHVADLEAEIARAKRLGALAECYRWLFAHDLLLFDGVDHTTDNEVFESDFIHVLDRMGCDGKTAVLSSCVSPDRLLVSNPRLSSLVSSGLTIPLRLCDEADRYQILRDLGEASILPDEILRYLAHNVNDSIRHLKAAALQIAAIAGQSELPIHLETARAVVPLPEDLRHPPVSSEKMSETAESFFVADRASFFRDMLGEAESEAEQALALQIAISQRIREIRDTSGASAVLSRFENALALLREGRLQEAMQQIKIHQKPE